MASHMMSVSELKRQVSMGMKRMGVGSVCQNAVSEQEAPLDVVLTYAQRTRIMQWLDASEQYQDDFRLDAPPDFTVWERLPDGSLLATVQQPRKAHGTPCEEPHEYAQPQEKAQRAPGRLARAMPCLEPLLNVKRRQTMDMARMQLQEFPDEIIDRGGRVRDVNLSFNRIDILPPEACESLTRLTTLDLANNLLEGLPEELGMMTKLACLRLSRNKIRELPEHTRKLVRLHTLDVHDNLLTEIPEGFGQLIALEELDVGSNRIEHVSAQLKFCPLRRLNLSSNQLTVLDEELDELWETLEDLQIHQNDLQFLPFHLVNFHLLRSVTFQKNQMVFLPEDLGSVVHMERLEAQCNKLRKLPQSIANLAHLTLLCVHNNGLERLPEGVGKLTALTVLNVQCNRLTKLPDGIHRLTNLRELTAQSNKVAFLPERGLGSLVQLETLLLNNNQIERVGLEAGLQDLPSLTSVDMDDNMFRSEDLPPSLKAMFHRMKGGLPVSTMARMHPDDAMTIEQTPVQSFDQVGQDSGEFAGGDSMEFKSRSGETSHTRSTRMLGRAASTATSGWGSVRAVKQENDDDDEDSLDEDVIDVQTTDQEKLPGFFSSFLKKSFLSSKGSRKQAARTAPPKTEKSFNLSKPPDSSPANKASSQSFSQSKPWAGTGGHSKAYSQSHSFSPAHVVTMSAQAEKTPFKRAATLRQHMDGHLAHRMEPASTTSPDVFRAHRERPMYGRSHTLRVTPSQHPH